MNTTRKRAWQGLNAILNEGQYANLWLRQHGQTLSEEEKRWVTAVIYGVLRHREPLRWQWRDLVRNVPEPSVAVLLDMSVYQLFYLDKGAEYAIVNDAVELCPRSKKVWSTPFCASCCGADRNRCLSRNPSRIWR